MVATILIVSKVLQCDLSVAMDTETPDDAEEMHVLQGAYKIQSTPTPSCF